MKFIATADWQLGMTARFLPPEARARYTQSRFEVLTRIGDLAQERGAEFIVVCGDVFETNQLDRRVIARTFEALRSVRIPIVLVPGNHDPLDSASIYDSEAFTRLSPDNVNVARTAEPIRVTAHAQVLPVPWSSKRPGRDLVAEACAGLEPPESGVSRVLAAHGAVASMNPDATDPATIDDALVTQLLRDGVIDVAVLGDRHSTTEVAAGIWYPGTPEVTARRDPHPGNVLVIEVPDDDGAVGAASTHGPGARHVQVEEVHVGSWQFVTLEQQFTARLDHEGETDDLEALRAQLAAIDNKSQTGVWLQLTGTITTRGAAELDRLIDEQGDLFALLEIWQSHSDLQTLPDGADFSDLHLTGFAQDALDDLVAQAAAGSAGSSPTTRSEADIAASTVAADALSLLYRLAGGHR
ncbi:metallophosphoesterase family protein [Pseudoclavibacter soli]|uniref:metallophosphoesterase family protein n=1 Tax=Pseudoclavibacter soli TaxID=452623 RepID=UPI0004801500|nr:DNA repair exonuclease [Pseudoclavibacter soli]